MMEVEVKVLLLVPAALRRALEARGAKPLHTRTEVDTYYRHPGRDFAATDEALRVRDIDGDLELTYKGPRSATASAAGIKSRAEHNVVVDGPVQATLEALGFAPVAVVTKRRETWQMGGLTVTLDDVEGLGTFAEVERVVDGDADGTAQAEADVEAALEALGLVGAERVAASYLELLLDAQAADASSSSR